MSSSETVPRKIMFVDNEAKIEEFDLPQVKPDQIVVQTNCSLISVGTETTALTRRWDDADFRANPGYALAGEVVQVGCDVANFKTGDRVLSLTNHASHAVCSTDPWATLKMPDSVSFEEATFTTLASVSLHGIRRARIEVGEDVVIIGMGLVGLLALQFAKMSGASSLIAVDLSDERLDLARTLGADDAINPTRQDLQKRIGECVAGDGAACVVEAAGNPQSLQSALKICASGGRVIALGVVTGNVTLNLFDDFILRELQLISAQQPVNPVQDTVYYHFTQQRERQLILECLAKRLLKVDQLLTHRISCTDAPKFYEMLAQGKDADCAGTLAANRDVIGVLIDWTR